MEGKLAGQQAGRDEGRAFGIEKGFEKYLSLGMIKGRTKIWESRISSQAVTAQKSLKSSSVPEDLQITNARHVKHVSLLHTLTSNPPIRNEEDDVEEVDDRIRRGNAKVKILENALGEAVEDDNTEGKPSKKALNNGQDEFEDFQGGGRLLGTN